MRLSREGIVVSISYDLAGCIQALINLGKDKDGNLATTYWVDTKRLKVLSFEPIHLQPRFDEVIGGEDLPTEGVSEMKDETKIGRIEFGPLDPISPEEKARRIRNNLVIGGTDLVTLAKLKDPRKLLAENEALRSILKNPPEVWLKEYNPELYNRQRNFSKRLEYEKVLRWVLKRMREKAGVD